MSQPKNTTAPPKAQAVPQGCSLALSGLLDGTLSSMQSAGSFLVACGYLMSAYGDGDISEEIMTGGVIGGLAEGMRVIGLHLQIEHEEAIKRLKGNRQGGAQ